MNDTPLAEQLRPNNFKDFYGQEHLVGPSGILRKLIDSDQLVSLVLWGPPGTGKTSLARIVANLTKSHFVHLSAVTTSLAEVRQIIAKASERKTLYSNKTIFFLDEIHRFNKAQQDALLPHVENGTIILIGATTENPSFEVIGPLLSRCRVLVLNRLNEKDLGNIIDRALLYLKLRVNPKAKDFLIQSANGDARVVLNTLEIASKVKSGRVLSLKDTEEALQKSSLIFDRLGEEHYNTISAFIKSMRASDTDAALYYLARMVEVGEDPLFIARRMVIFASEDVGMAQPTALVVANEVFCACEVIGYPECQINLAHGVVYLCTAKKDRSAYEAYFRALDDVKKHGNLSVPLNIRNSPTKLMKDLNYGKGYEAYPKGKSSYLPDKIKGKKYY